MGATVRLALSGVRHRGLGQVIVLVVVTALTSAAIVAGLAGGTTATDLVDDAYDRAGRPDVVLIGSADALRAAASNEAVASASPPARRAMADTVVDGDPVEVTITTVGSDSSVEVGAPRLVDGRWPNAANEVVVERSIVSGGVAKVGGTLVVTTPNGARDLQVAPSS